MDILYVFLPIYICIGFCRPDRPVLLTYPEGDCQTFRARGEVSWQRNFQKGLTISYM